MQALIFVVFALSVYFVPFAIGNHRGMRNQVGLFFLNLLFGWTVIGWFMLLLWSFFGQSRKAYYKEMAKYAPHLMQGLPASDKASSP